MADNTLRSFLVKLGFKIDKKSQHDFESGVRGATAGVRSLATAISAAAVTVAAGATKMAYDLNHLYFQAQRTGSSAEHLKAFSFAASNLGSSAQQAMGAVEGLATKIRQNPGTENLLQGIGVKTRDAHGHLRGTADMLEQFGRRAKHMQMYQAEAYANALGIPENLLLALRSGKFSHFFHQYEKMAKNSGMRNAVKQSHEFTVQLNRMTSQFELLGIRAESSLETTIGPDLKALSAWMKNNGPQIAKQIGDWAKEFVDFGKGSVRWFNKINHATGGWLGTLVKVAAALRGIRFLTGMKGLGIGSLLGFGGRALAANPIAAGVLGLTYSKGTADSTLNDRQKAEARQRWVKAHGGSGKGNRRHLAAEYFAQQGYSKAQIAGLLANIQTESGYNPNATGDHGHAHGIAQWHKARAEQFKKIMGRSLKGSSFMDQIRFMGYELSKGNYHHAGAMLRATHNARKAGAVVSRQYERPKATDKQARERGELANRIYSEVTINVNGVNDPKAVAEKINEARHQHDQASVRNFRSPAK